MLTAAVTSTDGGTAVHCANPTAAPRAGTGAAAVIKVGNDGTPPGAKQIPCPTRAGATPATNENASDSGTTCYSIGSGTPPTTLPPLPAMTGVRGTPPAGATEVPCGSLPKPPAAGTAVMKTMSSTNGSAPVARCYVLEQLSNSSTP